MTRKFIEAAAEEACWNVDIEKRGKGWYVCFTTDTACNQDVCHEFEVNTLDEIPEEVYERWQNYDPEHEAVLWYGERGAPDLHSLLADMDSVEEKLEDLYNALRGVHIVKDEDTFAERAGALRHECLMELTSISHRAKPSKLGYDAKGFSNPDECSLYEEVIFLNDEWTLVDGDSQLYSNCCMPLEEFCEMVDAIKKQTEV